MITPEEMREMAGRLDNSSPWSDTKQCDRNLSLASQMLRSIAAEREAPQRKRKPYQPKKYHLKDEPFTPAEVDARIDKICGCNGKFDCDCVSVFNQAQCELWSEHNTRDEGAE